MQAVLHESQNINIRTGGIYEASLLKALNSQVKIKAGGVADISSSELIEVTIFAGGDLIIHGKTKYVKQTKSDWWKSYLQRLIHISKIKVL